MELVRYFLVVIVHQYLMLNVLLLLIQQEMQLILEVLLDQTGVLAQHVVVEQED